MNHFADADSKVSTKHTHTRIFFELFFHALFKFFVTYVTIREREREIRVIAVEVGRFINSH